MKKYWGLLVVLMLSLGAIAPLLHSGFFPMHDDTQVVRIQQMAQALREQQVPVRWAGDLGYGYGYPIFNFYAPLAYYFGAFFNLLGLNPLLATKLMFVTGILLAGVFMYLLAREFWGKTGGVMAGLFYVYAPYHALDIYVRGAVGEFWAMAFLPLVFLGVYKINQTKKWLWVAISALAYAALILSHNLTAVIVTPLILLIVLVIIAFSKKRKQALLRYILFFAFALGLSAFYWLPALAEMRFTQVLGQIGGGADWKDHFVFLDQLWASPWGFAGSAPGRLDGMSFMLGKIHLVFLIIAIATTAWLLKRGERKPAYALLAALSLFLIAIFFTQPISAPIWQLIMPMAFIQYPWRFLLIATFSLSFMAGATMSWFKNKPKYAYLTGGAIILILVLFNLKYFQPQTYLEISASDFLTEEKIKWETSKISDEYLPKDFPIPQNRNEVAWGKVAVLEGEAEIKELEIKTHQYSFKTEAEEEAEIIVNLAYFPGWRVWLDGEETEVNLENGKIKLTPPPGEHQILIRLTNTPIRAIANLISLISLIGLLGFVIKYGYGRT